MIDKFQNNLTLLDGFPIPSDFKDLTWEDYSLAVQKFFVKMGIYSSEQIDLITIQNIMIEQFNLEIENLNAITPILLGAVNFEGEYVLGQTYAKNTSVTIGDVTYTSKIDNNSDTPPSINWKQNSTGYTDDEIDSAIEKGSSSYATTLKFS